MECSYWGTKDRRKREGEKIFHSPLLSKKPRKKEYEENHLLLLRPVFSSPPITPSLSDQPPKYAANIRTNFAA